MINRQQNLKNQFCTETFRMISADVGWCQIFLNPVGQILTPLPPFGFES